MKSPQVTKIQQYVLWLVILLLALTTRFFELTNKPIHFDESINGWFVMQMDKLGFYKYDPNNYHGPLYFYMLQAFEFMWGRSVATLRALPATFSVLIVMLFTFNLVRSRVFKNAVLLFLLTSPAMLFFGRSGIHETPFVFFQILFGLGVLRWGEEQDGKSLDLLWIGLFGMMTMKETFTITVASFVVGILFLGPAEWKRQLSWSKLKQVWSIGTTALLAFLLIFFFLFFTGFMRNPSGIVDFFRAFLPWMKTGVGETGHNKEFLYWVKVLFEAEPLAILGLLMAFVGLFMKEAPLRLMSAYALFQLLIYSLIPYKTVWCILTLVWGFYFVLAMFLQKLWADSTRQKVKIAFIVAILLFVPLQLRSSYLSVYREPISLEHPYVYVNSTYQLKELQGLITGLLEKHPELRSEIIQVGMKEQWPWPWVLRYLPGVHYDICGRHLHPNGLIYFCDMEDRIEVEGQLSEQYIRLSMPMRQARPNSLVYLRKNVFDGTLRGDYEIVGPDGDSL